MFKKVSIENIVAGLAVITTILSFSPNTAIESVCSLVMYLFWGIFAVLNMRKQRFYINTFVLLMILLYVVWFVITKIFYTAGVYPSDGLGAVSFLPYCIIFYAIGLNYQTNHEDSVQKLVISFIAGQVLLMLTILPNLEELAELYYLNGAKNQTGQILGAGIVLSLFVMPQYFKNLFLKLAFWIAGGVSLTVLLQLRSRTPLVAIAVVGIIFFINKKDKTRKDYISAACVILVMLFVIHRLGGVEYLLEVFSISEDKTATDFNSITNGRIDLYIEAIRDFAKNPIAGLGAYAYVDNFVLNVLRCGGLLLGITLLPLVYKKLFDVILKLKISIGAEVNSSQFTFTVAKGMAIFYFVISLMEGYPPLGPGTSTFFFWILLGITDRLLKQNKLAEETVEDVEAYK